MYFRKITRCIAALQAYGGKTVKVKQVIRTTGMAKINTEAESETIFSMHLDYVEFNANRGLLRLHDANNLAQLEFKARTLEEVARVGNTLIFTEALGYGLQRDTIIYLVANVRISESSTKTWTSV